MCTYQITFNNLVEQGCEAYKNKSANIHTYVVCTYVLTQKVCFFLSMLFLFFCQSTGTRRHNVPAPAITAHIMLTN